MIFLHVYGEIRIVNIIRGFVQLVHGMAEYILRYEEFAKYLARKGYIVCGNDHAGHGLSVENKSDFGLLR